MKPTMPITRGSALKSRTFEPSHVNHRTDKKKRQAQPLCSTQRIALAFMMNRNISTLLKNFQLFENFNEALYRRIDLLLCVRCHQGKTDQGILWRTSRRNHGIDKHAFFKG